MPLLRVNGDFKRNSSLWAPSNITALLFVSAVAMTKDQKIHIYVDGKIVATLDTDGKIETMITAGTHTIQAKYQNLLTLEYSFDKCENESGKKIFCISNDNLSKG